MASLYQRGDKWRASVCVRNNGTKRRETKTFDTKEKAEFWGNERERQLRYADNDEYVNAASLSHTLDWTILAHIGNLASEKDIVKLSRPYTPLCGIYFLIKKEKIVYVGQSKNVFKRLTQHTGKGFDRVYAIPCAATALDLLEAAYIKALDPPYNRMQNRAVGDISDNLLGELMDMAKAK